MTVAALLLSALILCVGLILSVAACAKDTTEEDMGQMSPGWQRDDQRERRRLIGILDEQDNLRAEVERLRLRGIDGGRK